MNDHDDDDFTPDASDYAYDPAPDVPQEEDLASLPESFPDIPFFSRRERTRRLRALGSPRISNDDVRWVANHANNPDYAHLPASAEGQEFDLTADLLAEAITAGFYEPHFTTEGHLIVAIRGARIANGAEKVIKAATIRLVEQKPDHRDFKCLVGVLHRDAGTISLFLASTVPNRGGMAAYANMINGHIPKADRANLLPTGCYELCVGTHHGKSGPVPNVLRLGTGPSIDDALKVTVLRTTNDGIYGTQDRWDPTKPADNIHPSFAASSATFSSLGCLTVKGTYRSPGGHQGLWRTFQQTAEFDAPGDEGKRFNLLLTTGMELAAILANRVPGPFGSMDLRRLSHGSKGPLVEALQAKLGVSIGSFGPATKDALAQAELKAAAEADTPDVPQGSTGIYTHRAEFVLGYEILT